MARVALSGTPALVRNDAAINFTWGAGSPGTGVPADGFSARWTAYAAFTGGNYTFTLTADDGARTVIIIEGPLIHNEKIESAVDINDLLWRIRRQLADFTQRDEAQYYGG